MKRQLSIRDLKTVVDIQHLPSGLTHTPAEEIGRYRHKEGVIITTMSPAEARALIEQLRMHFRWDAAVVEKDDHHWRQWYIRGCWLTDIQDRPCYTTVPSATFSAVLVYHYFGEFVSR